MPAGNTLIFELSLKLFNSLYICQNILKLCMKKFDAHDQFHKSVWPDWASNPGPEVIKLFSCSTQLSMKFFPLIDVKMPTIVGILTCMSGKNNILGLTEP